MNTLQKRIQSDYMELTDTNKLIADVILANQEGRFDLKLVELAQNSYCSNAAITKFIQYFGYTSYPVFVNDLNKQEEGLNETIAASFNLVTNYYKQHTKEIQNLIHKIKQAPKVYLFASGQSQLSAIDFSLKANKMEKGKYIFEANISTQSLLLNTISKDDFIIFVSNSGESRELIQFSKDIATNNITLVTNRSQSILGRHIKSVISLNNTFEQRHNFKEFPREAKYTLLFFFDELFRIMYQK